MCIYYCCVYILSAAAALQVPVGSVFSQPLDIKYKMAPSAAYGSTDKKTNRPSRSFRLRNRSLNSVRLRRIFDAFDGNGDGQISVDELGHALERLGLSIPLPDLEPTVRGFMEDQTGGLDFDGFAALDRSLGHQLSAPEEEGISGEEELKEVFSVFDENGDGFISAAELKSVLTRLGFANGDDVERMICNVDTNSDGLVDFEEFKHMMTKVVREPKF